MKMPFGAMLSVFNHRSLLKKTTLDYVGVGISVLVTSLLLIFSRCEAVLEFSPPLSDTYVVLGSPLWWSCSVISTDQSQPVTYSWRFQDGDISTGQDRYVYNNGTLYFPQVQRSHLGLYTCVASDADGIQERNASLSEAYISNYTLMKSSIGDAGSIFNGGSAVLECIIDAQPPPDILWTVDGNALRKSDNINITKIGIRRSILKITKASYWDAGTYRCNVSHVSLPQPRTSQPIQLSVYGSPVLVQGPRSQRVPISYNFILHCQVISSPQSEILWSYQGFGDMATPANLSTVDPTVDIDNVTGSLYLQDLQATDTGIYICEWSNQYGSVSANASLFVEGLPRAPTFIQQPVDTTVSKSDDLSLNCSGSGNPDPHVTWIHPSGTTLHSSTVSVYNSAVDQMLSGGVSSPNSDENSNDISERSAVDESGALLLTNVTPADLGMYTCKLSNPEDSIETQAFVNILFKPQFVLTPQSLTMPDGSEFTLPCKASGNPEPTITWKLPGGQIVNETKGDGDTNSVVDNNEYIDSDGNLHVAKAGNTHRGIFTCVATNALGSVETPVIVTIFGPPHFSIIPMSQGVIEGDKIRLHCQVNAFPAATVVWYYKYMVDPSIQSTDILYLKESLSQDELPSENMTVVDTAQDPRYSFENVTSLQIRDVQEKDAGLYICMATNDEGSAFEPAILRVITFPSFQIKPTNVTAMVGSTVKFDCLSVGIPVPSQRWLFRGAKLNHNSRMSIFVNGSLVIQNIQESEFGVYTCLATNQAGQRSVSSAVAHSTLPFFKEAPGNVTTVSGTHNVTLTCRGDSPTPFNVSWSKLSNTDEVVEVIGETVMNTENPHIPSESRLYIASDGDLVFTCVEKSDSSWYICSLTNSDGTIDSSPAYFRVNYIPTAIIITIPDTNIYSNLPVTMSCEAQGSPPPSISWVTPLKRELSAGYQQDNVRVQEDKRSDSTTSYVVIQNVDMDRDAGEWICKACTEIGCRMQKATLTVWGRAVIREITGREYSTEYSITCATTGQPEPTITYLSDGIQITNSTPGHRIVDKTLFIDKDQIKPAYTCQADSIYGSLPVTFFTPSSVVISEITPTASNIIVTLDYSAPVPHLSLSKVLLEYKVATADEWKNETLFLSPDRIEYEAVGHHTQSDNGSVAPCKEPTAMSRKKRQVDGHQSTDSFENIQVSIAYDSGKFVYTIQAKTKALIPNKEYEIRAAVANILGTGPFSSTGSAVTLASAPAPVTHLSVNITYKAATVIWSHPDPLNGRPEDVAVKVEILDSSQQVISEAIVSVMEQPSVTFSKLSSGQYTAKLSASNILTDKTSNATLVNFQIKEIPPEFIPEIDYIRAKDSKTIYLNWTQPASPSTLLPPVTGYVVHIWLPENNSQNPTFQEYHEVTNTSVSSWTIRDLQARKEYSVRVASSNPAGTSPYSETKKILTPFEEFSEDALDDTEPGYNISWRLLVIILICICSALVVLTAIVVLTHQIKLSKCKSVPITRDSDASHSYVTEQNYKNEVHNRDMEGYLNDGFIMY